MIFLYNIAIWFYKMGIHLSAFFNEKARLWVSGRKDIFKKLQAQIPDNEKIIWFHCASLGEFEQGRPLIEKIKSELPQFKILITFFSPSGYEIRKNYPHADFIFYLPMDSKKNAKRFLKNVKPVLVIFVKYEFWFHYLNELKKLDTPTLLISAIFRPNQIFFKSYGNFFKKMLHCFDHIFVQNDFSKTILLQNQISHVSQAGDTRVDRVLEISQQAKKFPKIATFVSTAEVIIGGSTWQQDEYILISFINKKTHPNQRFIIAPHNIQPSNIHRIEQSLQVASVRYSQSNTINLAVAQVLIIDNIGMLSSLYQYGKIAYIGGGFGSGIHNTLEPIAFGLPVIFGSPKDAHRPSFLKFEETHQLVKTGGGFAISNSTDFENVLKKLAQNDFYQTASAKARQYILENQGATETIFQYIINSNLLSFSNKKGI